MMMIPDMSSYPATKQGAEELANALLPNIIQLWKAQRTFIGDDIVVIVRASNNSTSLRDRSSLLAHFKRQSPDTGFVKRLEQSPPSTPGAVTIWTLINFPSRMCILPLTIARS